MHGYGDPGTPSEGVIPEMFSRGERWDRVEDPPEMSMAFVRELQRELNAARADLIKAVNASWMPLAPLTPLPWHRRLRGRMRWWWHDARTAVAIRIAPWLE